MENQSGFLIAVKKEKSTSQFESLCFQKGEGELLTLRHVLLGVQGINNERIVAVNKDN